MMNSLLKALVSCVSGVLSSFIWIYNLAIGSAVIHALVVIFGSGQEFSRSRGSMTDIMQWRSSMSNPLQGQHIDPGLLTIFAIIALIIGVITIIRGIRIPELKKSFAVNLFIFGGGLSVAVVVTSASHWLISHNETKAVQVLFIGLAISIGLRLIARFLLREAQVNTAIL